MGTPKKEIADTGDENSHPPQRGESEFFIDDADIVDSVKLKKAMSNCNPLRITMLKR